MTEEFHALVYFWIAFYKDGNCLPQFDFETGKANDFKEIDQTKLERFGLYPLNAPLAIKANMAAGFIIAREEEGLPFFVLRLQKDQRLIYARRNSIHVYSYQHCEKCGYEWQWMPTRKDGETTEVGLLIHTNHLVQEWQGKKFPCAICPKCGSFNAIVCPTCNILVDEIKEPDKEEHIFKCPKCGTLYPRYIQLRNDIMRKLIYLLGYQITVEGKNSKQIMFIGEDGTIELNENFNYVRTQ